MAVNQTRFGPGTFKLGTAPGTEYGCQVQSMAVNVNKDEGDTVTVLCGDSIPGSITYTYVLAGTFLQDLGAAAAAALVQYSWAHAGEQIDFEFTPATSATTKVAGKVIVDPLAIGTSDGTYGDVLTSDFEWSCVGKPTITWPVAGMAAEAEQPQEQPA